MITLPIIHDVIDGLEVLICGLDERGMILAFNRPCEQITGLTRGAAVGTSWLELFASGERHDHVLGLWDRTVRGEPAVGRYEALCRNGRSVRWQFTRGEPTPVPVTLWAVGIDITEDRESRAQARALERIATLGSLVSGLTHEMRNPLNAALLQLALADRHEKRSNPGTTTPTARALSQATAEVRRMSRLLDDFLVFIRPLPMKLERVDVRHVVEGSIERGRARASSAGVMVVLEPGDHACAEVDATRVETAVYHLLANAIDASEATREVRVRVEIHENAIAIEVEDQGAGIPAGEASIFFEPFFTTKKGGTGLGLAIVEQVAADHAGKISYDRRGGATVFRLELPIVGGAAN